MDTETRLDQCRELAHRSSGGIEVTLYWSAEDGRTTIAIWQEATEELLTFAVPPERALEAYHHPFAHVLTEPGDLAPARHI